MTESPAERLRWARREAGYQAAAAFARAIDVPEVTYRAHEKGSRAAGGRRLSERTARYYAEHLGVSWAWLLTGAGDPNQHETPAKSPSSPPEGSDPAGGSTGYDLRSSSSGYHPSYLPVRGAAILDDGESFVITGETVDRVKRPPALEHAGPAFALYVIGNAMAPRYEEGDLIFLHPGRPPVVGCDVVAELGGDEAASGPCYLGRLARQGRDLVVLQRFGPDPRELELPGTSVGRLYRVLSTRELLGF